MLEAAYRLAAPALALALGLTAQAHAASPLAVEAQHAMVVSAQHYASEVGVRILKAGGNAVDAAVAVGYALAVVDPCCGNIGGGGFMVLHLADGRDSFINFRETAPAAARETMYLDAAGKPVPGLSLYGYLAAGVPGTVMGLERARREYGRLPRAKVMAPAIKLAREGYVLSRADTDILDNKIERFGKDPVARRIFLKPDGTPFKPGERLVQKELAATLELDCRARARCLLQGRDRARGRQGEPGEWRHSHRRGLRPLHRDRGSAAQLRLSRLRAADGSAAELGRGHDVRDSRHPRGL